MIEPAIDAYGKEADGSALADYIELLALAGSSPSIDDLADMISDNGWKVRSRELFVADSEPPEAVDEEEPAEDSVDESAGEEPSVSAAKRVFEILGEREMLVGQGYPFVVDDVRLRARAELHAQHQQYLCLLAITVAHAYGIECDHIPWQVFEGVAARALSARGLETVNMGGIGRSMEFEEALHEAAQRLRLVAAPSSAPRRSRANEAGVDTVSHLSWGDFRAGHWVFIGQATCGKSDTWSAKIAEPHPGAWGPWLGCLVGPIAYLAVPHHVEQHHLDELTTAHRRLVLDRARLARFAEPPDAEAQEILEAVLAAGVRSP